MSNKKRLRGLRALVGDVVEHGSSAIETVHKAVAARTFVVLEAVDPIAVPAKFVHVLHDASLTGIYASIRGVNRLVGKTLDALIDATDHEP